jgi:uncharacterized DUF497 family protein
MEFEWNAEKREKNFEKHGVDLLEAAFIFDGLVHTAEDNRRDYGEVRLISLGLVDDLPYVVIHTERNGKIRLISAHKGGRKDYEKYKNSFP